MVGVSLLRLMYGPVGVAVDPPCFDDLAHLVEVGEQALVEAFVAQPVIKAHDEAILYRLARRDGAPFDIVLSHRHGPKPNATQRDLSITLQGELAPSSTASAAPESRAIRPAIETRSSCLAASSRIGT
jgi:hypothetical protein